MQCIILAGGLGNRVKKLTEQIPKPLIPICGRPFLWHQLKQLAEQQITDVVLSVGYKADLIEKFVKEFQNDFSSIKISVVSEGDTLLGTGGAIRHCITQGVVQERFFVLYGDSYLPIAFKPVWQSAISSGKSALMTVFKNDGAFDASNVIFDEGAKRIVLYSKKGTESEKAQMHFIDYGLTVLTREIISSSIPEGSVYDLATLFGHLSVKGELAGFEVSERFFEIGSYQGISDLQQYLENH